MTREVWGEFSLGDSTIISFDASVYEARSGSAEGTLGPMSFANGKSFKVKPAVSIQIDSIDVVGQEEDGGMRLSCSGGGTVTFFDEKSQPLFEARWKSQENQVAILVRQHIVADLTAKMDFKGAGKGPFEGYTISGELWARQDGVDAAGLGVFRISGKGSVD